MPWTPLVGHSPVLDQIRQAIRRDRLGHAFLFVGPDGIGKRRVATHVAQGLFCDVRSESELDPCGTCAGCRLVQAGSHPDYFEFAKPADKHELPIDVIADLCEKLSLKPARGKRKVAVLDDVDLLNEEAANAFLKTLEEPPLGAVLILLATSVEAQLSTIVSRCQTLRFSELATEEVASLLLTLEVTDDPAEARRLAEWGTGSVGKARDLALPEWRDVQGALLDGLSKVPIAAAKLTEKLQSFIEEAGKEAAPRRGRARQLIRLTADIFSAALAVNQGAASGTLASDARVMTLAQNHDAETLIDMIDRCLQADYHIGRFLHQALAVDCWLDDLAQIAAGQYIPSIGATGW